LNRQDAERNEKILEFRDQDPKTYAFVRARPLGYCALVAIACGALAANAQVAPRRPRRRDTGGYTPPPRAAMRRGSRR